MQKDITLKVNSLDKIDNKKMLMADVSIKLHKGEIFALVGERESGKTLLSKILVNVSRKTRGQIKLHSGEFIAIALDRQQFLPTESVLTTIKDYCKINSRVFNIKRTKNILLLVNMKEKMYTKISDLTPLEIARLKIALPIITRADVLILDDPGSKLTYDENKELGVLLKMMAEKRNASILITSRKLDKVEEYCDTIGIIDDGMIVAIKSYNEMIAGDSAHSKISVQTLHPNYAAKVIERELSYDTKLAGDRVIVNTAPANANKIVEKLKQRSIDIITVTQVNRSLQEIYYDLARYKRRYN
jgi:ABC-2 type transport system ATP-binding protein